MTGGVDWMLWASWAVTGLGLGLFVVSLFQRDDPIRRQRLQDTAIVLIFAGVLARVAMAPDRTVIDWLLAGIALIYIPLGLYRLSRTQRHIEGDDPQ
ncbi:MAG: hypothetical protein J0L52_00940 [Caulobacterales bacterium]|nr:hypothetical protein [Caulobacterales bacterium]